VIYLYIVGLIMGLAAFIYTSPTMDQFTSFHNNMLASGLLPVSNELQGSIYITQLAFRDWPIIYFILLTVAAYIAALKWRNLPA